MKLKKMLAMVAAGVLALGLLTGCGGGGEQKTGDNKPAATETKKMLDTIKERGKLVAGVKYDVPLFGIMNTQTNQVEGFEIDLMRELAKKIFNDPGKVDLVKVESKTRIPMLQNGQVDIVAGTMTITEERKKQVDFTDVYFEAGQSLLVKKGSPVKSVEDLKGKKVSTVQGSTSAKNIREKASEAQVVEFPTYPEAFLALQNGRADAMTTDNSILMGFAQKDANTQMVGGLFTAEPYGMAFQKGQEEWVQFVNEWLKEIRANGTYAELYKKWFKEEPPK
ncbi:MAG: ABC transporter substrate-binding protein [Clostridia bacterium]|nr:ABC transporter substrate-binding protein [Clostridia bacterium]